MDSSTLLLLTAGAALLSIIFHVLGIFKWVYQWGKNAINYFRRFRVEVPRETVRVIPQPHRSRWIESIEGDKPAMHLEGWWTVTNITDQPVQITSAKLKRPNVFGSIIISSMHANTTGHLTIPPHETYAAFTIFTIQPPKCKAPRNYTVRAVFTDQYGNEFTTRKVIFNFELTKTVKEGKLPSERLHGINSSIEKNIAAVLKAEINRFAACGPLVGGLGSVQITFNGKKYAGVGTEWRKSDSPDNQSLIPETEAIPLESDNATSLINLYNSLTNDHDKEIFMDALLARLTSEKEYADVGYLIVLVLFRVQRLQIGLDTAKINLQSHKHGFNGVLKLVDGLLRFEHFKFTLDDLDPIEMFLEGVSAYTYRIEERIAAIRALRLL